MRHSRRPRGFTIILAVVLLGLVAVAAAMIVHQLGYELQRTRTAYEDAQLRQLLLAGAQEIAKSTEPPASQPAVQAHKIELPLNLAAQGASLSVSPAQPGGDVLITAHLGTREAVETLHFDDQLRRWAVVGPSE